MHVAAVIKRKGSDVVSIGPDKTIAEAVGLLTENGIGAVLVLDRYWQHPWHPLGTRHRQRPQSAWC